MWAMLSDVLGVQLGSSVDSVGKYWLSNKKNGVINAFSSATLWCLWKLRNDLCFQRMEWKSMEILYHSISGTEQNWSILYTEDKRAAIMEKTGDLRSMAWRWFWLTP
ncbi:hypothetical protein BDA96_03G102500 [Sorghum bicolor]|uniref:Reverse transcriptase zinc-binding domain-containing protein n=1 Tax=Sorghum bicolor TaxID=4558 RepID=A0A921RBI8_SORBI|nr:hypothetical protein BDA96_03G102500 [Sorghum bicolor]